MQKIFIQMIQTYRAKEQVSATMEFLMAKELIPESIKAGELKQLATRILLLALVSNLKSKKKKDKRRITFTKMKKPKKFFLKTN